MTASSMRTGLAWQAPRRGGALIFLVVCEVALGVLVGLQHYAVEHWAPQANWANINYQESQAKAKEAERFDNLVVGGPLAAFAVVLLLMAIVIAFAKEGRAWLAIGFTVPTALLALAEWLVIAQYLSAYE